MKAVFDHIQRRADEYSARPLFSYLRDADIDPIERLSFVPYITYFVMSFADLYHFALPEDAAGDRLQELVNVHVLEEKNHWKWFLTDLATLGLDPQMRFTDAVRFLWGDATLNSRLLSFEMCKIMAGKSSLHKLTMVQAIEATGGVALAAMATAGRSAAASLGRSLVYCGSYHLDTEQNHTVEEATVRRSLEEIDITDDVMRELFEVVDGVFVRFTAFIDEGYAFVQKRPAFGTPTKPTAHA